MNKNYLYLGILGLAGFFMYRKLSTPKLFDASSTQKVASSGIFQNDVLVDGMTSQVSA